MTNKTSISRRNFMKSTAVVSSGFIGASAFSSCTSNDRQQKKTSVFPVFSIPENFGYHGLLFSQVGYELGLPIRVIVRLPKKDQLPENASCNLVPVDAEKSHEAEFIYWGEIWGSHWWVANFKNIQESGEWDIHVKNGRKDLISDSGLKVEKDILWKSTIEWSSVDMLERRRHFTGLGVGWQDAGTKWESVLDYSGGQVTDWGGHHPDIAQWGMGTEYTGPVKIQNAKAVWATHPVWNTATEYYFECIYANGVKLIISNKVPGGVTFHGIEGWAWANRGKHRVFPENIKDTVIAPSEIQLYKSDNHFRNFIDCVLSRKETIAPAEIGHRSITMSHLGNIAMKLQQDLDWNPITEQFINNNLANGMLAREMREPWASIYNKHVV